jgi:hypothetical protein
MSVSRRDTGRPEGRPISSFTGEEAVDTKSRREAAAAGDTDGARPGDPKGGEVGDRADFRGGLPGMQLWIPADEKRDASSGSNPRGGQPGSQLCRGCGHSGLLRRDRSKHLDGSGEGANLRSKGVEVNPTMAGSRSDGRRHGERDPGGNTARRRDLAAAGQHLPEQTGPDLCGKMFVARSAGPVCR